MIIQCVSVVCCPQPGRTFKDMPGFGRECPRMPANVRSKIIKKEFRTSLCTVACRRFRRFRRMRAGFPVLVELPEGGSGFRMAGGPDVLWVKE